MANEKQEMLGKLKGINVKGYYFSLQEDENKVVAMMTNSAVRKLINLNRAGTDLILCYAKVKDKKKRTTRVSRSEVSITGSTVSIIVKDLITNKVISKYPFTSPSRHDHDGRTKFKTLEKCIEDFRCKHGGELLWEANRTCKPQFVGIICCLTNGNCFSVHLVFPPTSLRCQILSNVPPLEGLYLSR